MSIASRIQEIETHIGDVYDTINYSYDTTGVNKNIINIPKYLKKGYIDIINNGIDTLYNNFPKVSGTGSNLSLTPTYEAPMKLNEIQGDTLQENTPTPDTPVEIQSVTGLQNINVCGKNLFDTSNAESRTHNGITFTLNNDGSITANGTATSLAFMLVLSQAQSPLYKAGNYAFSLVNEMPNNCYVRFEFYDNNNTMILRKDITKQDTATLSQDCYLKVSYVIASGTVLNNFVNYIQIEQGSTATTYEPYKGNTYEVNLGKNLFDINGTFTGNLIKYNNGFQLIKNSTNRTINYLSSSPIPKGTYTLSYEIVSSTLSDVNKLLIQFFNADNTNILTKTLSSTGSLNCILTEDVTKIYFYISNSEETDTQITFDNIQLEKGTQSTSFSPYFTPIELNKINTYQDSIKKSTGKNLLNSSQESYTLPANENYSQAIGEIYLEANTKYYISYDVNNDSTSNTRSTMYLQIGTGTRIYQDSGTNKNLTKGRKVWEYTPTESATYNVGYWLHTSNVAVSISNFMISTSNDTSYEPYGKVWYIEKNIGKVVLDGSETYSQIDNSSYSDTILRFTTNIDNKKPNIGDLIKDNMLSDKFTCKILNDNSTRQTNSISGQNGLVRLNIFIDKTIIGGTDTNTFKTWLSTHNTTIYYVLATPTTTEITNTELIEDLETLYTAKSQEGTTNISITSEDLEMILNISALEGEA
jgi:hypothetical protein